MPNPVHALAISYDDWHYVRCRCSGVETQAFKLRLEIIGVFPKLGTQFRLTGAELQRLENGRDHHGRKRTGVNIRVRVEARSEEHTSELQSLTNLVCRLLLEK